MKTFIKHPTKSGHYKDSNGNQFFLIEVKEGANVRSIHPRVEGDSEEAVALTEGLVSIKEDKPQNNRPKPSEMPKPVPQSVTPRQLRLALIDSNISLDNIISMINKIPDSQQKTKALTEWEYATKFERKHPLINTIGLQLKLSEEQIDELFRTAIKL